MPSNPEARARTLGITSAAIILGIAVLAINSLATQKQGLPTTPTPEAGTLTPTLSSPFSSPTREASPFPTLGATATLDAQDLKNCPAISKDFFRTAGIVPPDGVDFKLFQEFYATTWLNLGENILKAFGAKGLEHPAQILPFSELKKTEPFKGYGKEIRLFFTKIAPMGEVPQQIDEMAADLSKTYSISIDEARQQLRDVFHIKSVSTTNVDGKEKVDYVLADMMGIGKDGQPYKYLSKYAPDIKNDQFNTVGFGVFEGNKIQGLLGLDNRQGLMVAVTVENGKVKIDSSKSAQIDGFRIDYDDFDKNGCASGSQNVVVNTLTPIATQSVPTLPPPPPPETATPRPQPSPTRTPRPPEATPTPFIPPTATIQPPLPISTRSPETGTPKPVPTNAPTALPTAPGPIPTSQPYPTLEPTIHPGIVPNNEQANSNLDDLYNHFHNPLIH